MGIKRKNSKETEKKTNRAALDCRSPVCFLIYAELRSADPVYGVSVSVAVLFAGVRSGTLVGGTTGEAMTTMVVIGPTAPRLMFVTTV
jgi:hypothetical protein